MEKIKFPAHPDRGSSVAIYVGRCGFCSLVLFFKYVYVIYVCEGSAHECRLRRLEVLDPLGVGVTGG